MAAETSNHATWTPFAP